MRGPFLALSSSDGMHLICGLPLLCADYRCLPKTSGRSRTSGSAYKSEREKLPLCWENLKHENKMRQGIIGNCCFGHPTYIPAEVAVHLIAALPPALGVPLAFGPCTWGSAPCSGKGVGRAEDLPRVYWDIMAVGVPVRGSVKMTGFNEVEISS